MSGATRTVATVLAAAISFCAASSVSQAAPKGSSAAPLEGVWKITQVVTTGANAGTVASAQPGLIIYARGHYSYMSIPGDGPRTAAAPAKDPDKPTDAEKLAKYEEWSRFIANAGTYSVKGSTLTMDPMVAKNVAVMTTAKPGPQEFKLTGNSLVLTSKSPAGQPAGETRMTLTRVR